MWDTQRRVEGCVKDLGFLTLVDGRGLNGQVAAESRMYALRKVESYQACDARL